MDEFDLNECKWERVRGHKTELRIDARWILKHIETDKSYGKLRIVSHPDLPPGYLRAIFMYVTLIRPRNQVEKLQATEDYQMEITELEVYGVEDEINTETKTYEAPIRELENMFGVKVIEK